LERRTWFDRRPRRAAKTLKNPRNINGSSGAIHRRTRLCQAPVPGSTAAALTGAEPMQSHLYRRGGAYYRRGPRSLFGLCRPR
jgi:hypothetical protein